MTVTILIDLDDTLLSNNMDEFLPAYLKGLSNHLSKYVEPSLLVKHLLAATGKMTKNIYPDSTLEQVFDSHFYPAIAVPRVEIENQIQEFYAVKYSALKTTTRQNPAAIQLVEDFFRRGWQVVVATNPLFPRTAILQRLEWAGLPVEKYPFLFVPSYENLHFSKPHPECRLFYGLHYAGYLSQAIHF